MLYILLLVHTSALCPMLTGNRKTIQHFKLRCEVTHIMSKWWRVLREGHMSCWHCGALVNACYNCQKA